MQTIDARPGMFPTVRLVCCLAAVAMIVSAVIVWRDARLESGALANFIALGITMIGLAAAGAAGAVYAIKRRLHTAAGRSLGALAATVIVVAVASATLSACAYTDPYGTYARHFGSTGQCLAGSPYDSERARFSLKDNPKPDQMRVSPQGNGEGSSLLFDHASKGEMAPADDRTRQIIGEYAC
ncbi:hypothetical protein ACFTZI_13595 [Streptomyces decoyicus]|uniref:hypothetical protein n=1 Tax=Streptomyces decoyicus TaxID=249567 RepID=UPI00362978AD